MWAGRITVSVESVTLGVLGREETVCNKQATGRPKDLLDAESLIVSARER